MHKCIPNIDYRYCFVDYPLTSSKSLRTFIDCHTPVRSSLGIPDRLRLETLTSSTVQDIPSEGLIGLS